MNQAISRFRISFSGSAPLAAGLLLLATGCMQLETTIELHPDGSGTVTERLAFSRRLLKMAESAEEDQKLLPLLTREAALERMQRMGRNIRLVTHGTRDREDGGRESLAVFKIDDLGGLTYVSPFVNAAPRIKELRVSLGPRLEYRGHPRLPSDGKLKVRFTESEPRARKQAGAGKQTPQAGREEKFKPPPDHPQGLQVYRALAPVFADVLDGFLLRVTFKSYAPIDGGDNPRVPLRNAAAHPRTADIIHFSSENLDANGARFLENEEVMLALLRGHHLFWRQEHKDPRYSPFLERNLKHRASNHSLPLLHNTGMAQFDIKPSRALFDRFYAGKNFRLQRDDGTFFKHPARFSEIGWQPGG